MARYFGKRSKYLLKKNFEYDSKSLVFFLLALVLFSAATKFFSSNSYLYIILMLIFVIPLMKILRRRSFFYKHKSKNYEHGDAGEYEVKKVLIRLDDQYSIYPDVHLNGQRWNIDYVVCGP